MSIALREAKCFRRSTACAGQISDPVQRRATSASPVFSSISRSAAEPQRGQTCGNSYGFAPCGRLSATTSTICGSRRPRAARSRCRDANILGGRFRLHCAAWRGHDDAADRDRLQPRHGMSTPVRRPESQCPAESSSRVRREIYAPRPSAARARRSRAASANRCRRPYRPRRRCRSRASPAGLNVAIMGQHFIGAST